MVKQTATKKRRPAVSASRDTVQLPQNKLWHLARRYWFVLIWIVFILTRGYIWWERPLEFTEIIYSYMPYAHLWASGTTPYLEQWYEYPPLTIPLFYLPHVVDMATLGWESWSGHINYLQAYRGLMMLIDIALFGLVWQSLRRWKARTSVTVTALLYYCLLTAKAHDFIYDTMDWAFAAALALSVAPALLAPRVAASKDAATSLLAARWITDLQNWLGYWLAIGLKLMNGPLGLPLAIVERRRWRANWPALVLAGGLVWGVPLLLYRSSLQVMLVFHQLRGLQVDSFTAIIVRTINSFTHTESIIEVYKNYETAGPLTTSALAILDKVFILALVGFVGWATWQAWHWRANRHPELFKLSVTFGYIILLMIISKVLSRPFMLWHVPLLAMIPFKDLKSQLRFLVPSSIAVAVTLSAIPDFPVGPFRVALFVGIIRSLAYVWLLVEWWRWHKKLK